MTPDFSNPDACAVTIVAIVRRMTKIPVDHRNEVAQRAFIRIAARTTRLSVSYVRKVAWNIFLDMLRENKNRAAAEAQAERRPTTWRRSKTDDDAVQCIDDPFRGRTIMDEVAALPDDLREVMQRNIDGDTPAEIATALKTPPGTIRWRLRQARLRVAKGLGLPYGKLNRPCRSPYQNAGREDAISA